MTFYCKWGYLTDPCCQQCLECARESELDREWALGRERYEAAKQVQLTLFPRSVA